MTSGFSFGGCTNTPLADAALTGAKKTGTTGGFSFGKSTTSTSGTTGTGSKLSFGTSTAKPSLFGSSTSSSTSKPSLFSNKPSSSFSFGKSSSLLQTPVTNLAQQQQQQPEWLSRLQSIQNAYDPSSPWFQFRFMLYNYVQNAALYKRPSDVHPKLWQQAVANNPDPTRLVPVEAKGFPALKERVAAQDKATASHLQKLSEIEEILATLQQKHDVATLWRLEQYAKRHRELVRRTLHLMRRLELLAAHGQGISADEEAFVRQLSAAATAAARPDQFRGRLAVLAASAQARPAGAALPAEALPADTLSDIYGALQQMSDGIKVLNETMMKDVRDLQIIDAGLDELPQQ